VSNYIKGKANFYMNNIDIIEINDEQAYNAKFLASGLSEAHIRKRGMIDMLGINCAINYLYAKKIKTSTQKSVYKVPLLFEEFKRKEHKSSENSCGYGYFAAFLFLCPNRKQNKRSKNARFY